jgi:hypothetical protein
MTFPQIGPAKLPNPKRLSAVLADADPARFFDEFSNFSAYFLSRPQDKWPPLFRMYNVVAALDISVDIQDLAGFFDHHEDHSGAYAHEAEAFLREIGAPHAADLLADAIKLFPGSQVPKDHQRRRRLTERMREQEPDPLDEVRKKHEGAVKTMYVPLQKYLRAHERELQAEVDAAASVKKRRTWRTLDAALALATASADSAQAVSKEYAALLAVWDRIDARVRIVEDGFEGLTRGERLFYILWFIMDSDIENGGLHQFFSNSSGDFGEEARRGLKEIGADQALAVLQKASAVFPGGVVPAHRQARNEILEKQEEREGERVWDAWGALNREYYQAQQELYARLLEWVRTRREEFPDPDDDVRPKGKSNGTLRKKR